MRTRALGSTAFERRFGIIAMLDCQIAQLVQNPRKLDQALDTLTDIKETLKGKPQPICPENRLD